MSIRDIRDPIEAFNAFIAKYVDPSLHAHFTDDDDNDAEYVRRAIRSAMPEPERRLEPCHACGGRGTWETECCNGSSGCPCRGGLVEMGSCHACGGYGAVEHQAPMANANYILSNRIGYPGGGPSDGWLA